MLNHLFFQNKDLLNPPILIFRTSVHLDFKDYAVSTNYTAFTKSTYSTLEIDKHLKPFQFSKNQKQLCKNHFSLSKYSDCLDK